MSPIKEGPHITPEQKAIQTVREENKQELSKTPEKINTPKKSNKK